MRPRSIKVAIGLLLFAAVAFLLFWLAWFFAPDLVRISNERCYVVFEQAFPLADAWCGIACVVGAAGLWLRRPWGLLFTLMAGGAAIFLGLMDLLYDLEYGTFLLGTAEAYTELLIVLLLLALGPVVVSIAWKERAYCLSG